MTLKLDKENKFCDYSGGVCAGLAKYTKEQGDPINVTLIRLLFIIGTIFWGLGPLIYLVLWVMLSDKTNEDV